MHIPSVPSLPHPAHMPSFDAVIEPDLVELKNAVEQANKEIGTRFDFKGSSAKVDLASPTPKTSELTLCADSDFQLEQVKDVLIGRLSKRGVDVRLLDFTATPQKMSHGKLKLAVPVPTICGFKRARKLRKPDTSHCQADEVVDTVKLAALVNAPRLVH